ncbi:MAG TPA: hypothetical protein VN841_04280 [Bryobacteraceae bacterium]|nr:hypothetical protein [Bryobacteraceae bacterium]
MRFPTPAQRSALAVSILTVVGITAVAPVALPATTPPSLTVVSGNNQTGALGSLLVLPLVVKYTQNGSASPGIIVNFAVSNDAVPSAPNAVTAADGTAIINLTIGRTIGPFTVTATAPGAQPAVFNLIAIALPSKITTTGDLQSGLAGFALPNQLCVTLIGASGDVAGATVLFSVVSGGASINPASGNTNSSGTFCTTATLGPAGSAVVSAATSGLVPALFSLYALGPAQINSVAGAGASVPAVTAISPNGWVSLYGTNFAAPGTTATAALTQGTLPTTLAGICVTFGGIAAPLSLVSPTQINALVPGVAGQAAQVQVVQNCGADKPQPGPPTFANVQAASPEFLYWSPDPAGHSAVVAVNAVTGAYVGPPGLLPSVTLAPAKPGDYLTIYAIGFGATNPPYLIGVAPPAAASTVLSPSVSLGTALTPNAILYAGISPNSPGLYQLNIQVPPDIADGDYSITLRLGGFATPQGPYVSVRH